MARSKKRAAPTAASERGSKKRKSAEAGMAKMKEIADAEEAFSEDERAELMPLVVLNADAGDESEDEDVDVEDLQDHDVVVEEKLPVVAPGFRLWETSSKLASKGDLSQTSKYDEARDRYSHILKINHDEPFKLVPLMVTQGPYKGSHVFMLQPQTGFFRFMDLPPEIRTMVYSFLFEADEKVRMTTHKRVHQQRRPVVSRTTTQTTKGKLFHVEDKSLPVGLGLLRTSKQMLQEAAPVLYGDNHFQFEDLGDMRIFLDHIGSMRPHLRHIVVAKGGWWRTKARAAFSLLKDSTQLRTLSFFHADVDFQHEEWIRRYITTTTTLVSELFPMLFHVYRSRLTNGSAASVLDVVKIYWKKCSACAASTEFAENCKGPDGRFHIASECKVKCKDAAEHCEEVEAKIRAELARRLCIKE